MLFEYMQQLVETQDGKILFVLALIAIAMTIDYFTGTLASRINPSETPNSGKGINGILRKIASMVLMVFFIPVSVLIPSHAGTAMLYTLYIGYLLMEILSLLENFERMGVEVDLFRKFLEVIRGKSEDEND